jgi:predicted amidohydrolase YtcJ
MHRRYSNPSIALACLLFGGCTTSNRPPAETAHSVQPAEQAEMVLRGGKVFTHNQGFVDSFAVKDGKFVAVGFAAQVQRWIGPTTRVVDAGGRTVIPGLIDTHAHPIREGLNYALELRWDGVRSLATALDMLKEQAKRTPEGQWVRVVGGWSMHQFEENRLPTLAELNAASPDRPVFVLYLYSFALLNRAALEQLGYDAKTRFPGGKVVLGKDGKPTGLLVAKPSALLLYKTLVSGPKLKTSHKLASTLHWIAELNRFGLTSVIDAGGGGFFYPEDHAIVASLIGAGRLTLRLPFFLFAPEKGKEHDSFKRWMQIVAPTPDRMRHEGTNYHMVGGGENITWSAADFENFFEPRPDLPADMESKLEPILRDIVANDWDFRIHATYNESIERMLPVIERVLGEKRGKIRFIIDHAETITKANIARIKRLGGGISVQHRMAYQGEAFIKRYGEEMARRAPPVGDILAAEVPLGSGTDHTRVASYNPWVALYWHVSGKTVGGTEQLGQAHRVSRTKALYLLTKGAAWFSREEQVKGDIRVGELADFAVLDRDYFTIEVEQIHQVQSLLTVIDGRVGYAAGDYAKLMPVLPPLLPEWSPVRRFGGYGAPKR